MIAAATIIAYVIGLALISQTKTIKRADFGSALVALAILGAGIVGVTPFDLTIVRVSITLAIMAVMCFVAFRQYHWCWGGGREAEWLRHPRITTSRKGA